MMKPNWHPSHADRSIIVSFSHPVPWRGTVHAVKGWFDKRPRCGQIINGGIFIKLGALDKGMMKPCKKCWEVA